MNLDDRLQSLPETVQHVLREAVLVASDLDTPLYLVGGVVRDLVLGRPTTDVDLAVEGHAAAVAQALAQHFAVPCRTHARFNTASLRLPSGVHVDVATARTEVYPHPASLPVVTRSTLVADLSRRDFSINALAVRLDGPAAGTLVDPTGGWPDLQNGVVRVLHHASFVDDPTRIFRAVRFEQRLHFRLDETTLALALAARQDGFVGRLSAYRLKDELLHVLQEESRLACLYRLQELGLLGVFHARLRLVRSRVERLAASALPPQHVVACYGAALLSSLSARDQQAVCVRFSLQAQARRFKGPARVLASLLQACKSEAAAYRVLHRCSDTTLQYWYGRIRSPRLRGQLEHFLKHSNRMVPVVRGEHLRSWGYAAGAHLADMLDALAGAQIEGAFTSLDEARSWTMERYPRNNEPHAQRRGVGEAT